MKKKIKIWQLTPYDRNAQVRVIDGRIINDALEHARINSISRKFVCGNGMQIIAHALSGTAQNPTIILDRIRESDDYPGLLRPDGTRGPLSLTDSGQLIEPTYISFLGNNYIATIQSTSGPYPQRFAEYLNRKIGIDYELIPVLRTDIEDILEEIQLSKISVSIPANYINDELLGPLDENWAVALRANRDLVDDGIVNLNLSVGRSGNEIHRQRIRQKLLLLIANLVRNVDHRKLAAARVEGVSNSGREIVNLLEMKLAATVEIDRTRWANPDINNDYIPALILETLRGNNLFNRIDTEANNEIFTNLAINPQESFENE